VEIKYAQPKAAHANPPQAAGSGGGAGGAGAGGAAEQTSGKTGLLGVVTNRGNIHSEYYGLANAYGRSGWKAGYGTLAFGEARGWNVDGWETFGLFAANMPKATGFSFETTLKGGPYQVTEKNTRSRQAGDNDDDDEEENENGDDGKDQDDNNNSNTNSTHIIKRERDDGNGSRQSKRTKQ
jgi:hypothetical protein